MSTVFLPGAVFNNEKKTIKNWDKGGGEQNREKIRILNMFVSDSWSIHRFTSMLVRCGDEFGTEMALETHVRRKHGLVGLCVDESENEPNLLTESEGITPFSKCFLHLTNKIDLRSI